jgi:hypothetical protein
MNQATHEASLVEAESHKVNAFTQMSSEMSNVGAHTISAIAPAMADVVANHKKLKAQADGSYEKIGQIWQDVFGAVVEGLVEELQVTVDTALSRLRREGNVAIAGMVADAMAKEREKQRELERARELDREREAERECQRERERQREREFERQREREREMEMALPKRKPSIPDLRAPGIPIYGSADPHDYDVNKRRRMDSPAMAVDEVARVLEPSPPMQQPASDPVAMLQYMQDMMNKLQADKAKVRPCSYAPRPLMRRPL